MPPRPTNYNEILPLPVALPVNLPAGGGGYSKWRFKTILMQVQSTLLCIELPTLVHR